MRKTFWTSLALLFWLFSHPLLQAQNGAEGQELFLSLNIEEGTYLEFSDGSTFEIEPDDRLYTSFWITPIPVILGQGDDPEYPVTITNLNTGTMVKGKEVSLKELLKREKAKEKALPAPKAGKQPPIQEKEPTKKTPSAPQKKKDTSKKHPEMPTK